MVRRSGNDSSVPFVPGAGPTEVDASDRPERRTEVVDFGGLSIAFDDRVLRPRPWTVAQSWWAAEILAGAPEGRVLELCSGAGQIGLLAVASSSRRLVCVDVDPVACEFSRRNADEAGLSAHVEVRQGTVGEAVPEHEQYAMIIADPPWVPSRAVATFPGDPPLAIDGGADGGGLIRECVRVISRALVPGGSAVLQVGSNDQASSVGQRLPSSDVTLNACHELEGGVLVRLDRPSRP